ncbi:hypothetical protein JOEDIRT_85 [Mycobacterium phage JoeDirt]|uniref:Uncharacterized protein n=5 Tax=Bronvirus TaxID=1623278 RepID=E0YPL6_9CAUD|nr:hypothetical protein LEBRON_83 [Mycobacterium phage LeBron]YP_009635930.1 hypothetical protein FGG55_gp085 [Mycobacterium phage JoeDirt]YP_010100977.1 hypothetical protein KNU44_gp081 [Mycobacterium phage CicholasNage]AEK07617.1 hypothetical protein UPIE_83 [Mycobacterium phage UPIE]AEZ50761.1 hypothetical protein [Mycobacterium phage Fezzik]AZS12238.1 hypothetical protein SEA_ACQUIRE49_84 [Mycobacterium phage Acquire49]QDK04087.1 hypothetical protein SEA_AVADAKEDAVRA_84 [Mycobacterium pha
MIGFLIFLFLTLIYLFVAGMVYQRTLMMLRERCTKRRSSYGGFSHSGCDHAVGAGLAAAFWPFAHPLMWGISIVSAKEDDEE